MKNIIILFLLFGFGNMQAQKLLANEVPKAVVAAFKKANPAVTKFEWNKDKTRYQVRYVAEKRQRILTYTPSGTLVALDGKVAIATLPPGVKIYLDKNYADRAVDKVTKMTKLDGSVNYNVEVSKIDLYFDAKGNYLKSVKK